MTEVLERPPVMDTVTWLDIYKRDCPQLFFTALLITGAVKSAEAAIDESLDLVDMGFPRNCKRSRICHRTCACASCFTALPD